MRLGVGLGVGKWLMICFTVGARFWISIVVRLSVRVRVRSPIIIEDHGCSN